MIIANSGNRQPTYGAQGEQSDGHQDDSDAHKSKFAPFFRQSAIEESLSEHEHESNVGKHQINLILVYLDRVGQQERQSWLKRTKPERGQKERHDDRGQCPITKRSAPSGAIEEASP